MQLISLEHPAENAEKFIVFREFSPVALDINVRDVLGSAKTLFSWDSEINQCIVIKLCLFIDICKTVLTYIISQSCFCKVFF